MVPTELRCQIHAHGMLEIDDAGKAGVLDSAPLHLTRPARHFDAATRARCDGRAIVAFRMRIKRLEGKFKLSQNRSDEDRD
jgi:predicted FMN-binding regulatory protein PaiB